MRLYCRPKRSTVPDYPCAGASLSGAFGSLRTTCGLWERSNSELWRKVAATRKYRPIATLLLILGLGWTTSACHAPTTVGPQPEPASKPYLPPAPRDGWTLLCTDPLADTPALVWNGVMGVRIGRDGAGVGPWDGPGGFLCTYHYEPNDQERILPLPNPFRTLLYVDGTTAQPRLARNYSQELDLRTGLLRTRYSLIVSPDVTVRVLGEAVAHPTLGAIAHRIVIVADGRCDIALEIPAPFPRTVVGAIEPAAEYPLGPQMGTADLRVGWRASGPNTARWSKGESTWRWGATLAPGQRLMLERVVHLRGVQVMDFDAVARAAKTAWRLRWHTDIELDGPLEDQLAIRSFLFYLRAAMHPTGPVTISPFATSDPAYGGHVFWDADVWVFPALALLDPEAARAIPAYRIARAESARKNYRLGLSGTQGPSPTAQAIQYPWESSVSGLETARAPTRLEHHVTGSVLWGLWLASALGLAPADAVNRIGRSCAEFWSLRASPSPESPGQLEVRSVVSPDEYKLGDNDLYTNLVAQWTLRTFRDTNVTFKLPRDATTYLTYDGDRLRSYKQHAALLALYPLQWPQAEVEASQMLDRYLGKTAENGPAMSLSLEALLLARFGDVEQAYRTWKRGWELYADHPLMLFSEYQNRSLTYFTTGPAICLQSVLFGFLGFRVDNRVTTSRIWSHPLRKGYVLTARPRLPKLWKAVRIKNLRVLDTTFDITCTHGDFQANEGGN